MYDNKTPHLKNVSTLKQAFARSSHKVEIDYQLNAILGKEILGVLSNAKVVE